MDEVQQTPAGKGDRARRQRARHAWWQRLWDRWLDLPWLAKLLLLLTGCVLVLVGYALLTPHQWIFSVQATTQVVEIKTPSANETKWRIDGATLCVRGKPTFASDRIKPLGVDDTRCGGSRWSGFALRDTEQTLIVRGALKAIMEQREGRLVIALRDIHRQPGDGSEGQAGAAPPATATVSLSFTDGSPDVVIADGGRIRVNLVFAQQPGGAVDEHVFPFIGATTIGRDVNWAGSSLLTSGDIEVYTADVTADKRKQIDKAKLLLGDQVRLAPSWRDEVAVYPKGFVRFSAGNKPLDVVAFGAADRVRIERFGDNGYDLKPGLVLQLLNNQMLILVLSLFVAAVSLISSVASTIQIDNDTGKNPT